VPELPEVEAWVRELDPLVARAPIEIHRFLLRFAALDVADEAHAAMLLAVLERPPQHPEILVGGRAYVG